MRKFLQEFKAFAMRGNVIDLAVGIMIGGAFQKIVTSLVNDLFMPMLSILMGRIDIRGAFVAVNGRAHESIDAAKQAGVNTINYGAFLTTVIDFLIMAFCVFWTVKLINRLIPAKPVPKTAAVRCPFCKEEVREGAERCPHCTSALVPGESSGT